MNVESWIVLLCCVLFCTAYFFFWTFVARESTNRQISIYLLCVCSVYTLLLFGCSCSMLLYSSIVLCWFFGDKNMTSIYFKQKSLAFKYIHIHWRKFTLSLEQKQKWIGIYIFDTFPKLFFVFLFFSLLISSFWTSVKLLRPI